MTSGLLSNQPQYDDSIYTHNFNRDILKYETNREKRIKWCNRLGCFVFIVGTNILSFYLGNKFINKI